MRLFSLLVLMLAAPASARRPEVPPADTLLTIALDPAENYVARGRVQVFPRGSKPRTQYLTVSADRSRYYKEIAPSRRKPAALVLSSDGNTRSILLVRSGSRWSGPAIHEGLAQEQTLRELYALSASTGGIVAKRNTWRLDFREKKSGLLRRSWWVERRSGVVVRREHYRQDGSLARRERFSWFEERVPAESLHPFAPPSGPARPWAEPGGLGWRPEGFVPLEFRREGETRVYGYGDGHASLTLVSAPAAGGPKQPVLERGPGGLSLRWRCGARDCRLLGDVLEDELRLAAASVEAR